jgi:hypothetical protein
MQPHREEPDMAKERDKSGDFPIGSRDRDLKEPMRRPTKDEADKALGKEEKDKK